MYQKVSSIENSYAGQHDDSRELYKENYRAPERRTNKYLSTTCRRIGGPRSFLFILAFNLSPTFLILGPDQPLIITIITPRLSFIPISLYSLFFCLLSFFSLLPYFPSLSFFGTVLVDSRWLLQPQTAVLLLKPSSIIWV